MSFESYHYADVDENYQPPKPKKPKGQHKDKGGTSSLDSSYIHRIEVLETRMRNAETKLNKIISTLPIIL